LAKRALVTGGTGQDGSYLIELLLTHNYVVHAGSRRSPQPDPYRGKVTWHTGEIADYSFLEFLITTINPHEIYNLAAISRPVLSWSLPLDTAQLNAVLPHQICELIRKNCPKTRFFQASSSEIFGESAELVQNERTRCDPKTPYGITKYYAHRMVGAYRELYGLHLSSGILFNHESPRRPLSFVSQKIAHAAAALHLGLTETPELDERGQPILSDGKLKLGGLTIKRDFGFAGDYVEAMFAIVQAEVPDDYVIGTGQSHSIAEFCDAAFARAGLNWKDHVVVDSELVRRVDAPACADASKLRADLGWRPKLGFNELVASMVDRRIAFIRQTLA
jgi:GDPmannose 4,6-dehydratase